MPATFAHPAIVVPLAGRLPLSALVIGAMAPDLFYLWPGMERAGHAPSGVVTHCLPLGLAVMALFQALKRPIVELLPEAHAAKLSAIPRPRTLSIVAAFAIVLGAASHLAWDGFTHSYGWAVLRWPTLAAVIVETDLADLRLYKALQHGSTLLGTAYLVARYLRWFRVAAPAAPVVRPAHARRIVAAIGALSAVCGLAWSIHRASQESGFRAFRVLVVQGFAGSAVALLAALLLYALVRRA